MTDGLHTLEARLALVREALARSSEPLHIPLGVIFRPLDGEAHLGDWADLAARAARGEVFAPATLYAHVPFCARVCTYCLLSAVRTPGRDAVAAYLAALRRQIGLYEPAVRGLRFGSLHLGGGTPTLLDERQLDALLGDLRRLPFTPEARFGVEAHPGTATPGRLAVLRAHGVHRVSFGVETLTPDVLRNVHREDQTEGRVRTAVSEARKLGLEVNIDLLAGLPGETDASWDETVRKTLALQPDSLSVNRFLGENSPLARFGYGPDETETLRVDGMLLRADAMLRDLAPPRFPQEPLRRPGFGRQYGWDRTADARRYFQDDMIGPVSTLALGHGALGHVHGRHFAIAAGDIQSYVARLASGHLPAMLAAPVDDRFERAFFVADRASRGDLTLAGFQRVFGQDLRGAFPRELAFLLGRRLLTARGGRIAKPPHPGFQPMHLLAFLLRDERALAEDVRALIPPAPGPAVHAGVDEVMDLVTRHAAAGATDLEIDVGDGLDGATATRLAALGARLGLAITVRGSARRPIAQYEALREELPLSMVWVRIAIRASQASRGEQRLAVLRAT